MVKARKARKKERRDADMGRHEALSPLPAIEAQDVPWVLAAAVVDSIAEDLALTLRAGWWEHRPEEMLPNYPEAAALLEELNSERVMHLMDNITAGTRGAVQCGRGWLLRQVRHKVSHAKGSLADLSRSKVAEKVRLPSLTHCRIKIPEASCRECGSEAVKSGRCDSCRKARNERVRKARDLRRRIPTEAMSLKQWALAVAQRLGIGLQAVRYRLELGQIAMPPVVAKTPRSIWVLPEFDGIDQAITERSAA